MTIALAVNIIDYSLKFNICQVTDNARWKHVKIILLNFIFMNPTKADDIFPDSGSDGRAALFSLSWCVTVGHTPPLVILFSCIGFIVDSVIGLVKGSFYCSVVGFVSDFSDNFD